MEKVGCGWKLLEPLEDLGGEIRISKDNFCFLHFELSH